MALEYAKLPDDPEVLKQMLLQHAGWVDALTEEVIRLRRWRFGRSSEVLDPALAPELPLAGGLATAPAAPKPERPAIPKLLSGGERSVRDRPHRRRAAWGSPGARA